MFAINLDLLSLYVNCMPLEGPKLVNKICLCLCTGMYFESSCKLSLLKCKTYFGSHCLLVTLQ